MRHHSVLLSRAGRRSGGRGTTGIPFASAPAIRPMDGEDHPVPDGGASRHGNRQKAPLHDLSGEKRHSRRPSLFGFLSSPGSIGIGPLLSKGTRFGESKRWKDGAMEKKKKEEKGARSYGK